MQRQQSRYHRVFWGLLLGCSLLPGCTRAPVSSPPAAGKAKAEGDLTKLTLSADQRKSLGIRSEVCPPRPVQSHLRLTGWITPRQGCEVTITAPVPGYIRIAQWIAQERGSFPSVGAKVSAGQPLLDLEPILGPVERVQLASLKLSLENELTKAREGLGVAESELRRVLDLHRQGLRGQQEVEQTQARLKYAQADLAAAQEKLKAFAAAASGQVSGSLKPVPLLAPRPGTLLAVQVSPGQYVQAAAPLVTLADLSQPWLRVPVPEHELPRVDLHQPVTVCLPCNTASEPPTGGQRVTNGGRFYQAEPLGIVPHVDLARHTADLLYAVQVDPISPHVLETAVLIGQLGLGNGWLALVGLNYNGTGNSPVLAKDQMVSVCIPVVEQREEMVVPLSAIVFDAYGGTWIYLDRTPPQGGQGVYERRRVELGPAVDGGTVVRPPCQGKERVVVAGVAALFSCEFYKPPIAGKPAAPIDDDD